MAPSPFLSEVPEADATGSIASVYSEIRATLGIPFVGLIYRTLASEPGRLETVWSELRPFFADPATWQALHDLRLDPRAVAVSAVLAPTDLERFGAGFTLAARATLDGYHRANRLNLLALSALVVAPPAGLEPGRAEDQQELTVAPVGAGLLPMLSPASLAMADRAALLEMSAALLPQGEEMLVPSLLRHFAIPGLLPRLWQALRPAISAGSVARAAAGLRAQAAVAPIPSRLRMAQVTDPSVRDAASRFVVATSTMVVTGALIRRALRLASEDA